MKNEKGITLLTLVITVMIMGILIYVGVSQGNMSYTEVKLQNFSYQLQQIQGQVDVIHEKMAMEATPNYIKYTITSGYGQQELGIDMRSSSASEANARLVEEKRAADYDYRNASINKENPDLFYKESSSYYYSCYRYFPKSLLKSQLDIKNPEQDVIINFKTREVISIQGISDGKITYYTLESMR